VYPRLRLVRNGGPAPKFTDSEVITLELILETVSHGQEELGYAFVSQNLAAEFRQLLDLDRLNARLRDLIAVVEAIRQHFRDQWVGATDPLRLVASAPIELVTYPRGGRCRSVVGAERFGVVTGTKAKVFGWRLPVTAIANQLFNDAELEDRLWRTRHSLLLPLRKDNQQTQWPAELQRALGRARHRVETVVSTLTTVFNLQRPRGRSLAGHVVRSATCILAHTLSFLMT
jgi:hypothetical protein